MLFLARGDGRRRVLGARRHRGRRGLPAAGAGGDAAPVRRAGAVLPRQGRRLRAATLRSAVQRQRRRLRRGVHRRPPASAVADCCWSACRCSRRVLCAGERRASSASACRSRRWCWCSARRCSTASSRACSRATASSPTSCGSKRRTSRSNIALTRYGFGLDRISQQAVPGRGQADAGGAGRQRRHHPEHPLVGPAAAARHLSPAAGDPPLLRFQRRRRRPLHARRHATSR